MKEFRKTAPDHFDESDGKDDESATLADLTNSPAC